MSSAERIATELRYLLLGITAALLPEPENRRAARRWGVDVGKYSMALGLVEAAGGGLGFLFGAIAFMMGAVPIFNMVLLENWFPELSSTHIRGGGIVALVVWCTHPLAWFFIMEGITGVARIVAYVSSGEAVGEPLVWVVVRVAGALRRLVARQRTRIVFGPLRSDRLLWKGEHELEILCCRTRADWELGMTLGVDGRFLRLVDVEERVEGAYGVVVHRFEELDEREVIRRAVPYVDTAELLSPAAARRRGARSDGCTR